jgi:hypothetical protein
MSANLERLTKAMESSAFPCNPIPFANGLAELVRERGTDAIRSPDAQRILWILMAQSYGQLAKIDLCDEWDKLVGEYDPAKPQE